MNLKVPHLNTAQMRALYLVCSHADVEEQEVPSHLRAVTKKLVRKGLVRAYGEPGAQHYTYTPAAKALPLQLARAAEELKTESRFVSGLRYIKQALALDMGFRGARQTGDRQLLLLAAELYLLNDDPQTAIRCAEQADRSLSPEERKNDRRGAAFAALGKAMLADRPAQEPEHDAQV